MTGGDERLDTRRRLLSRMAAGAGALTALRAAPARADTALDVQVLQTASSLEALAVLFYGQALGEGPDGADAPAARAMAAIGSTRARDSVGAFARDARRRHAEHRKAFQARTAALGGRVQDAPNPKFLPVVTQADLPTPARLIEVAATMEKVATDSYLLNLSVLQDAAAKRVMASVLPVVAQHLAVLRALGSLLEGAPDLVSVPFPPGDVMKLPGGLSRAAVPDGLHQPSGPEMVAEPASGALQ